MAGPFEADKQRKRIEQRRSVCKGPAACRSQMHVGCAHQEVMAETGEREKAGG